MVDYISTKDAAKIMGVTDTTIINRINAGALRGKKFGNNWMVDKGSMGIPISPIAPPTSPVQAVNPNVLAPEVLRVIARYNDTGEMTANEIVLNMESQIRSIEEFLVSDEYNAFKNWQRERAAEDEKD